MARTQAMMQAEGLEPHGLHHEIYLSDPRRVLRTILRQPVERRRGHVDG